MLRLPLSFSPSGFGFVWFASVWREKRSLPGCLRSAAVVQVIPDCYWPDSFARASWVFACELFELTNPPSTWSQRYAVFNFHRYVDRIARSVETSSSSILELTGRGVWNEVARSIADIECDLDFSDSNFPAFPSDRDRLFSRECKCQPLCPLVCSLYYRNFAVVCFRICQINKCHR